MYEYIKGGRRGVKAWVKGVLLDDNAKQQLLEVADLPFVFKHVAAMPDVHWGIGATVGSVIATQKAIVPAAVGVDIGCGMAAVKTSLKAKDLPDNLRAIRLDIEKAVPHGTGKGGSFQEPSESNTARWWELKDTYERIVTKHPKALSNNNWNQIGTLGSGNHFIEVCLDENDDVWVMLHSGSRGGVGNRIGSYFISKAKEEMRKWHIEELLPNQDLAYLVENTELFDDYVEALNWAQEYARVNREAMMDQVLLVLRKHLKPFTVEDKAINCHHNYVDKEHHFGSDVWVTRKGAVRARKGDLGIIPGSMGTGSFIVEGLGNKDSFHSCSHGAGRVMSRTEAKRVISVEDHKKAMKGIEGRLDSDVLDESPAAYKDINSVMEAQKDLVRVLYHLRQVINVKG